MVSFRSLSRCLMALAVVLCLTEAAHAWWRPFLRRRVGVGWYTVPATSPQSPTPAKKKPQSQVVPMQAQVPVQQERPVESWPQPSVVHPPIPTPAPRLVTPTPTVAPRTWQPSESTTPVRYGRSVITFDNQTGEPALVRLVGPTRAEVYVANGSRNSIRRVEGGHYFIRVRFGTPGDYRYIQGDAFDVRATSNSYSMITITLHGVVGGNYGSRASSEAEFAAAAP